jgi:hypothetical protein
MARADRAGKRDYVRRDYVQKVAMMARVGRRIEGGEDLTEVCRDPTMPARSTVVSWAARHPELRERLEAAYALSPAVRRVHVRWSDEVAAEFLARIEDGRGLREVCAEGDMPAHCTVTRWLNERPEFAQAYQTARVAQADRLFDLAWRIACDAEPADVAVARLKISTIKWRIGRLAPRKYGPWWAVAAAEAEAAAAGAEAAEPQVVFYPRHFAVTPERQVVEITDAVEGLDREGLGRVSAAVRAGRYALAPNGQVAGVWDG